MKRYIVTVFLILGCFFNAYGQNSTPADLILVLDTSAGLSSSYQTVSDYITGAFLSEYLRIGDTFHLIPFSSKPRLDSARRVQSRGDVETIIGRMLLQYPLENGNDIGAALRFAEEYVSSLPSRPKKIVLISTGGPDANNLVSAAKQRLGSAATLDFVQVTPGQPLTNLPQSGRSPSPAQATSTPASPPPAVAAAPAASPQPATPTPSASAAATPVTPSTSTPAQQAATAPAAATTTPTPPLTTTPAAQAATTTTPAAPPLTTTPAAQAATTTTPTTPPATTPVATSEPSTSPAAPPPPAAPAQSASVAASQPAVTAPNAAETSPAASQSTAQAEPVSSTPQATDTPVELPQAAVPTAPVQQGAAGTVVEPSKESERKNSPEPKPAASEKPVASRKSAAFSLPLIIASAAAALLILGIIIFFAARKLRSGPNRVIARAASPKPSYRAEKAVNAKYSGHGEDIAKYAAVQNKQRVTPYANRPARAESSRTAIDPSGPLLLNLFVEDQNTAIGKRNIHSLKTGYSLSVGGGKSDFLIFLVPVASGIGEIRRDGSLCTFIPRKPKYFPDLGSSELRDCINKTIRIVSDRNYEVRFRFEQYEDPLHELNRLFNSLRVPG